MTAHAESKSAQQTSVPNYYEEFRLNREDSIETVKKQLERIRMQWRERASLAGRRGEEAREKLKMIADAEAVFENDETREEYDLLLLAAPEVEPQEIDWRGRAWSYYFGGDYGASGVAARLAREADSKDPFAFVISAWVELKEGDFKRAKEYADTAFVLNDYNEDKVDIYLVRGVAYRTIKDYDRGLTNLERALQIAPDSMIPTIRYQAALCFEGKLKHEKALENCLLALEGDPAISSYLHTDLINMCLPLVDKISQRYNPEKELDKLYELRKYVFSFKNLPDISNDVINYIDLKLEKIRQEMIREPRSADKPEEPLGPLALLAIAIITFMLHPNAISLIVFFPSLIWIIYYLKRLSEHKNKQILYRDAQSHLDDIESNIREIKEKYGVDVFFLNAIP